VLIPAAKGFSKYGRTILLHVIDDSGRCIRLLVAGAPDEHFKNNGSERDSLRGQAVVSAAAISGSGFAGDDAGGFELLQTVGKYVGGDAFAGALEFAKGLVAADHHVSNEEQGPAVAEDIERDAYRASRAAFRAGFAGHGSMVAISLAFCNLIQYRMAKPPDCRADFPMEVFNERAAKRNSHYPISLV
jgi:hypothetical protein